MRGMWEYFTLRRAEAKKIRDDAAGDARIQGQWQQVFPFRKSLEQARRNEDVGCSAEVVRKGFFATRAKGKSSEWAPGTIREAHEKVVKHEAGRLGIVRDILIKSTDCLRRIMALVGGMGGVILSCVCPHCNNFLLEDCIWCVSTTKEALQLVVCNLWRKV